LPESGSLLLEVTDASKRFGGLVANDKVSFKVRAGEVMALIGPNGAGKSTMFNGISGVDPLSSGASPFVANASSPCRRAASPALA
jgi:ABC-type branched-subunit amino acid transport system ATPase component